MFDCFIILGMLLYRLGIPSKTVFLPLSSTLIQGEKGEMFMSKKDSLIVILLLIIILLIIHR